MFLVKHRRMYRSIWIFKVAFQVLRMHLIQVILSAAALHCTPPPSPPLYSSLLLPLSHTAVFHTHTHTHTQAHTHTHGLQRCVPCSDLSPSRGRAGWLSAWLSLSPSLLLPCTFHFSSFLFSFLHLSIY